MSEHDDRLETTPTHSGESATPTHSGESATSASGESTTSASAGTGDARVDEALTRLSELDDLPVHDHAAVVDDIHRSLQDTIADDEG